MSNAVWNWTADLDTEAELQELRGTVEELRTAMTVLQADLDRSRRRERDVRKALAELAGCGIRGRKRLIASLRSRKLLTQ